MRPSPLSSVSDTSANPSGCRPCDPTKMTSSPLRPRMARALVSPNDQRTASATLLLPEPFGPHITETPGSKRKVVRLAKLLNPTRSSRRRCISGPEPRPPPGEEPDQWARLRLASPRSRRAPRQQPTAVLTAYFDP